MRAALVAAGGAIAAIALVVVLGLGLLTPSGSRGVTPAQPIAVRTSLVPRAAFFGDPVAATVTVSLDSRRVRPDSVRLQAGFGPYVQLRPPTTTRTGLGRTLTITYAYALQCVSDGCLPDTPAGRTVRFPDATAVARRRDGGTIRATAVWKPLAVAPRVPASALQGTPSFRRAAAPPPAPFGLPAVAADILAAAAGLLMLAACALIGLELRAAFARRRAARRPPTPLELAVAYAREAAGRGPDDRRRALGLLGRTLRTRGRELASKVDDAAWSEDAPSPDHTLALADEARE
ncbi:MAG TPA: hypothetical protein VHC01_10675 [Gaiellaceae bacterium]|nr:hypothetical protein [Gaiellaceae bacterium]